jgi:hypothetical protein
LSFLLFPSHFLFFLFPLSLAYFFPQMTSADLPHQWGGGGPIFQYVPVHPDVNWSQPQLFVCASSLAYYTNAK